jgi:Fur family transcriptional regulator, ferric uptake regulator
MMHPPANLSENRGREDFMPAKKLEKEKDLFYEYLRQNGMKRTHQKDLILEVFLSNEGHLSVEDIYALVKRKDKKVGIVTVFRTLKSLTACGIAKEISLGDGLTRFEHCYHHPVHHHIICTECQKVIEFLSPELERVQQTIVDQYQFQPLHQRIQIYGVCRECRAQQPNPALPQLDTGKVFARDALRLAVIVKRQVTEFYKSAAACNQDPAGRAAFEAIAQTEQAQAQALELELEMLQQQEKGLERAPVMLHFDSGELNKLVPCLQGNVVGGEMLLDARRVREVAGQLGTRSAEFFKDYAERFGDCDGKRIFQRLADQAARQSACGDAGDPSSVH